MCRVGWCCEIVLRPQVCVDRERWVPSREMYPKHNSESDSTTPGSAAVDPRHHATACLEIAFKRQCSDLTRACVALPGGALPY